MTRSSPALAPTDAARQALLRRYFEQLPDGSQVQPTAGHHALAALAASGRVRVILTTNFDRLIERALDQAGVAPQVTASSGAVDGMTPLVHAPTTVIKLHGDYLSLGLRNTPDELAKYPDEIRGLLSRIFDEHGLVIVGWSAEYDTALVEVLESAPSRRYPTYWTTFSWAKYCPQVKESAGKRKGRNSRGKGNRYVAGVLGEASVAAGRAQTRLGARYRRLAKRRGKAKDQVAVGNTILTIVHALLSEPAAEYHDLGADYYNAHTHHARQVNSHLRALQRLGYKVTLTPSGEAA